MKKLREFLFQLREFVYQLLLVDLIRLIIASIRYFVLATVLRRFKVFESESKDIGINTVHHNHNALSLDRIWNLAVNRSKLLINPLAAIRMSKRTPILCIGPRAEGELLYLKGFGFKDIRGYDLMSYSPWVDLGDMHNMPYKDDSFGVIIMGWVIAYSDSRKKAAAEAVRVVKNGGRIAVGVEFYTEKKEDLDKRLGYEFCNKEQMMCVQDILDLFGRHVDRIEFTQDVPDEYPEDYKFNMLVIFTVKK
ncbi:MAG: hypothetical protein CMB80_00595 [Flammeovirgaceae bacterium]|nr:hypothetical protein [Flammeovirgaceae bacterium]